MDRISSNLYYLSYWRNKKKLLWLYDLCLYSQYDDKGFIIYLRDLCDVLPNDFFEKRVTVTL